LKNVACVSTHTWLQKTQNSAHVSNAVICCGVCKWFQLCWMSYFDPSNTENLIIKNFVFVWVLNFSVTSHNIEIIYQWLHHSSTGSYTYVAQRLCVITAQCKTFYLFMHSLILQELSFSNCQQLDMELSMWVVPNCTGIIIVQDDMTKNVLVAPGFTGMIITQ
jgi:hypothetical protein